VSARRDALIELLAKVEAGGSIWPAHLDGTGLSDRPFGDAYNGDLNAAKALHEAVLPGYNAGIMNRVSSGGWAALVYPKGPKSSEWVSNIIPARAWLIAILQALIAEAQSSTTQEGKP
jgi:hypothetical protein